VLNGKVHTQRPLTIRHRTCLFEEATEIVEHEYACDLTLDYIARRVASSRRQLQRAYAEIGNTTFREQLTTVRMERAAELLRSGGPTVRDVSHRVGYRQPAQFAKAFRRHHGMSPSAFRARGGPQTLRDLPRIEVGRVHPQPVNGRDVHPRPRPMIGERSPGVYFE
jgi:AraC family transcriptional regulator, regulatory protein of adaptative response / methylphosphotriester-DNA alkyltransferase methyltransferase